MASICLTCWSGGSPLLPIAGQKITKAFNGIGKIACPRQRHDAKVIRRGPVESAALSHQYLLFEQQVQHKFFVVDDIVHFGIQSGEDVQRALRFDAGNSRNLIEFLPGEVTLLE